MCYCRETHWFMGSKGGGTRTTEPPALCWCWGTLEESTQALLAARSPRLLYFKGQVNSFDCIPVYSIPQKCTTLRCSCTLLLFGCAGELPGTGTTFGKSLQTLTQRHLAAAGRKAQHNFQGKEHLGRGGLLETLWMKPRWSGRRTSAQGEGNGFSAFSPL